MVSSVNDEDKWFNELKRKRETAERSNLCEWNFNSVFFLHENNVYIFFRRQANSNSVRAQAQIVCLRSDIYLICIRPDSCLFRSSLFFLSISPIVYYECVHIVHIQFVFFCFNLYLTLAMIYYLFEVHFVRASSLCVYIIKCFIH